MKAPLCSVCGLAHWALCQASRDRLEAAGQASSRTLNRRARADYNAYQRDYMRRRRAAGRG